MTIFLDIDGVMNVIPTFEHLPFTPESIEVLNRMTNYLEADIVISSSWRLLRTVSELQELMKERGVTGNVSGKTSRSQTGQRGEEILDYVVEHGIRHFIVLDDEISDMALVMAHVHQTNYRKGLTLQEIPAILELVQKVTSWHLSINSSSF